nr:hypothetical protein [uncultured Sphingorhabdus sp.]
MPFGVLRLRRFSDAPLALLIGTPAKRVKENGAPSLKHPFARVFTALRPFAAGELKWVQCGPLRSASEILGNIHDASIPASHHRPLPTPRSPHFYTNAYTFAFEKRLISVAFPKAREHSRLEG